MRRNGPSHQGVSSIERKNCRGTIQSLAEAGQEGLSGGSQCKFGPKKRIKAPRKRSKIVKWMGSGLPGKKKQCKEAAPKYNISNAFERESGLIEQGR